MILVELGQLWAHRKLALLHCQLGKGATPRRWPSCRGTFSIVCVTCIDMRLVLGSCWPHIVRHPCWSEVREAEAQLGLQVEDVWSPEAESGQLEVGATAVQKLVETHVQPAWQLVAVVDVEAPVATVLEGEGSWEKSNGIAGQVGRLRLLLLPVLAQIVVGAI